MIDFDIPFNETIYKNQLMLALRLTFKGMFKPIKKAFIPGIIFLVLGLVAGLDDMEFFNPFTFISIVVLSIVLVLSIVIFIFYSSIRKTFIVKMKENIVTKPTTHYTFSDVGLKCSTQDSNVDLKWSAIKGYKIIDDNIFVMLSKEVLFSIIIGKSELTEENYNSLIDILGKNTVYDK